MDMQDFPSIENDDFVSDWFFCVELFEFVRGNFLVDDDLYICGECELDD